MIQFGKCLNDIPIDKIYEGMRVACKNPASEHFLLGKVFMVRKDKYHRINFSLTTNKLDVADKYSSIHVMFDNDVLTINRYNSPNLRSVFFVEESK